MIVTNPTVSGFHLEYLKSKLNARELSVCTIPDGKSTKLWKQSNQFWNTVLPID